MNRIILLSTLFLLFFFVGIVNAEEIIIEFDSDDFGSSKLIELPNDKTISSCEITECKQVKTIDREPKITFSTSDTLELDGEKQFLSLYEKEVLYKKNKEILHVFSPKEYYEDGFTVENKYLQLTIETEEKPSFFQPMNNTATSEYVVITTSTYWDIFNDSFKQWKIGNDSKINDVLIVNISDITSNSSFWVNGTYGDAVNISTGNHWVFNDTEITDFALFNDTQCKIRNFIRYCVDELNTEYVLLAGNKNVVPTRQVRTYAHSGPGPSGSWYNYTHAVDLYYAGLHGNWNNNSNTRWGENNFSSGVYWATVSDWDWIDYGYDVLVGRATFDTTTEAIEWINKTKNYVSSNTEDYLRKNIVASKDSSNNIDDYVWGEIGDDFNLSYHHFVNNQNISQTQWSNIHNYVNGDISGYDGIHFIHHSGHGGTLWNPYSSSNCNNDETPNFVYTEGCHSADFGTDTSSRMESWMSDEGCAFAGVSNSAYGWFIASTWYSENMIKYMFNETMGINEKVWCKAHFDSREDFGWQAHSVCPMIYKETNYFGDPSLEYNFYEQQYTVFTNKTMEYNTTHATLNGYLSEGGDNITVGFHYGYSPKNLSFNVTAGNISEKNSFSKNISVNAGQIYFYQAWLKNNEFKTANSTKSFITYPEKATNINCSSSFNETYQMIINISWNKGDGANTTYIERHTNTSWNRTEGTVVYNGTSNYFIDYNITENTTYYYQIWSQTIWNTTTRWSDSAIIQNTTGFFPSFPIPSPINMSYNDIYDLSFKISISNPESQLFNISFYWGNDTLIDEINTSDYTANISLPDYIEPDWLEHNTTYSWYVNVSNETGYNISDIWSFTTCQPWDLTVDAKINYIDISDFVGEYGDTCIPGSIPEDINEEGKVNYLDLSHLVSHYGEQY